MVVAPEFVDELVKPVRLVWREDAIGNGIQPLPQHRQRLDRLTRAGPAPAPFHHLLGGQTEDKDVVLADTVEDLDVRTIESANGQRAVKRELHVAGTRSLHARRGNLLRQIGRRYD